MKVTVTCNCTQSITANLGKSQYADKVCPNCGSKLRIYKNGNVMPITVKNNDRKHS